MIEKNINDIIDETLQVTHSIKNILLEVQKRVI